MTAIRIASISIVAFTSLCLLALAFTYMVDPFYDNEWSGWKDIVMIADLTVILLSAIGVLMLKAYAWWVCQLLFVINLVCSVIYQNLLWVLVLVAWTVIFTLHSPKTWLKSNS